MTHDETPTFEDDLALGRARVRALLGGIVATDDDVPSPAGAEPILAGNLARFASTAIVAWWASRTILREIDPDGRIREAPDDGAAVIEALGLPEGSLAPLRRLTADQVAILAKVLDDVATVSRALAAAKGVPVEGPPGMTVGAAPSAKERERVRAVVRDWAEWGPATTGQVLFELARRHGGEIDIAARRRLDALVGDLLLRGDLPAGAVSDGRAAAELGELDLFQGDAALDPNDAVERAARLAGAWRMHRQIGQPRFRVLLVDQIDLVDQIRPVAATADVPVVGVRGLAVSVTAQARLVDLLARTVERLPGGWSGADVVVVADLPADPSPDPMDAAAKGLRRFAAQRGLDLGLERLLGTGLAGELGLPVVRNAAGRLVRPVEAVSPPQLARVVGNVLDELTDAAAFERAEEATAAGRVLLAERFAPVVGTPLIPPPGRMH